jgi:hypothetical protein
MSTFVLIHGRSLGGWCWYAEYRPDEIKTLVYVTAILPRNGESIMHVFQQDRESLVLTNAVPAANHSYTTLREEVMKEASYSDCSDEDVTLMKALRVPQAMAPLTVPIHTSEANFGRIPRVYVKYLRDRSLTPAFQQKLYTAPPCQRVISMNTSHSPFFSAPGE